MFQENNILILFNNTFYQIAKYIMFGQIVVTNQWGFHTSPPFHPMITHLTLNPSAVFEKWVDQSPLTLTGATVRSLNPTYPIMSNVFKRWSSIIDMQLADITAPTFLEMASILDTTSFELEVTNSNNDVATDTKTITAILPVFYWVVSWWSKPTKDQILIDSWSKMVIPSNGTIILSFNSWPTDWLWFAIPNTSTSKTKWFVDVLNNGFIGWGANLFDSENIVNIDSPNLFWSNEDYKIYVSNRQSWIVVPMQLLN